MKRQSQLLLLLCLFALGLFAQEWDFHKAQGPWTQGKNLNVSFTPQGLLLETTGPHSQLKGEPLDFTPGDLGCLRIVYTATGPKQNIGFFFFGTDQEPDFAEDKKFTLPPILCDGRPHEFLLDLAGAAKDQSFRKWKEAKKIVRMRLDLATEPDTQVTIQSISLEKVDRQKLLSNQFAREIEMGIPLSIPVDLPPDHNPGDTQRFFQSALLSYQANGEGLGQFQIRKRLTLDQPVTDALWQSICDDNLREVWVNGTLLDHSWSRNWREPDVVQIPPELLVQGENLLAVSYENRGSQGGVMADLQLVMQDGSHQVVTLEGGRIQKGEPPRGWEQIGFSDDAWRPAAALPPPPARPWMDFEPLYYSNRGGQYTTTIQLVNLEGLQATVRFQSQVPFSPEDRFYARLSTPQGKSLRYFLGNAEKLGATLSADGTTLEATFTGCEGEYYGDSYEYVWDFGVITRKAQGDVKKTFHTQGRSVPGAPLATQLKTTPAGVIPTLDNAPFYFTMFTDIAHYRGTDVKFAEEVATGLEGPDSPFNVIAIRLGGSKNLWWVGPDQYDFREVDFILSRTLALYPDSKLAPFVWCHPGRWYDQVYPERVSRMEDESKRLRYYVSTVSFDDPDVRKDAQKALDALVKHVEERFGSKVVLYLLMGGISCEWQGWAAHSDTYADFSDLAQERFREVAAQHGLKTQGTPRGPEREASLDGVFRSPTKNPVEFLYDRYYSQSIAECLDLLAETTKKACSTPKLVGCYYGYHMEYGNLGHCVNGGGHNNLERLLASPWMDIFLSPQSYGTRSLGAPNAEMKPYGSIAQAGKLSMLEDDTRTSLTSRTPLEQTLNLDLTLNVLKRNIGMSLCHGVPLNHLALIEGRELAHPKIRELIRQSRKAGQFLLEKGKGSSTRVAAVIDEEALACFAATRKKVGVKEQDRFLYSHEGSLRQTSRSVQPISGDLLYYQRIALAQFGAPVDVVLLPDLLKNPGRYDMVIFLNAVLDRPLLRETVAKLKEEDVILVFPYGVGFLGGEGVSADTMSQILGMAVQPAGQGSLQLEMMDGSLAGSDYSVKTRFQVVDEEARPMGFYQDGKQVAVAEKRNVYFYGSPALSRDFLREVARRAGVHLYLESGDNLYASRDVVSIHASHRGDKTIRLPERSDVVDVYTGEVLAKDVQEVTFPMEAFQSRVLMLGKAEEILKAFQK